MARRRWRHRQGITEQIRAPYKIAQAQADMETDSAMITILAAALGGIVFLLLGIAIRFESRLDRIIQLLSDIELNGRMR